MNSHDPERHPTGEELIALRDRRLDDDSAIEMLEHLVQCSLCATQFKEVFRQNSGTLFPSLSVSTWIHSDTQVAARAIYESLSTPPPPPFVGRYRLAAHLGSGAQGDVYAAFDEELAREVAVKVSRRLALSAGESISFREEARRVAALDHPAIVPVYDFGTLPDGRPYIVSQLIKGHDLSRAAFMAGAAGIGDDESDAGNAGREPKAGGTGRGAGAGGDRQEPSVGRALGWERVAEIVRGVAAALYYAHQQGVVHRDVKPSNILISSEWQPFLVDFGLALNTAQSGVGPELVGTASYMSPEQAARRSHLVDGRSDVFSLGVVLYELLTGRRPFLGRTVKEVLQAISEEVPPLPRQVEASIPPELEAVCLKSTVKAPGERYQSCAEMWDDLGAYLATARTRNGRKTPLLELKAISAAALGESRILCAGEQLTVGRSFTADWPLPDDDKLSRVHFKIRSGDDGVTLVDLHSTNGTMVNGELAQMRRVSLGDVITAGRTMFTVAPLTETAMSELIRQHYSETGRNG